MAPTPCNIFERGCPRFYHTYADESYHLQVRRVARRTTADTFSARSLAKLRLTYQLQAEDVAAQGAASEFDIVHAVKSLAPLVGAHPCEARAGRTFATRACFPSRVRAAAARPRERFLLIPPRSAGCACL